MVVSLLKHQLCLAVVSDVRSLLKAKRAERGSVPTSKASARAPLASKKGKRKADEAPILTSNESEKRRRVDEPPAPEHDSIAEPSSGFPSDFFSDGRTLPLHTEDDAEEDAAATSSSSMAPPSTLPASTSDANAVIEAEWEAFQRAMNAPKKPSANEEETFARATVVAEPELLTDLPEGFPAAVLEQAKLNAAAATTPSQPEQKDVADDVVPPADETAQEKAKRKEAEERELIVDRLLEEERAQEEADAKVSALRARMEMIKRKRAEAKAAKQMG